jgi:hypothetical protein
MANNSIPRAKSNQKGTGKRRFNGVFDVYLITAGVGWDEDGVE